MCVENKAEISRERRIFNSILLEKFSLWKTRKSLCPCDPRMLFVKTLSGDFVHDNITPMDYEMIYTVFFVFK